MCSLISKNFYYLFRSLGCVVGLKFISYKVQRDFLPSLDKKKVISIPLLHGQNIALIRGAMSCYFTGVGNSHQDWFSCVDSKAFRHTFIFVTWTCFRCEGFSLGLIRQLSYL